jgi:hypothetical protein
MESLSRNALYPGISQVACLVAVKLWILHIYVNNVNNVNFIIFILDLSLRSLSDELSCGRDFAEEERH